MRRRFVLGLLLATVALGAVYPFLASWLQTVAYDAAGVSLALAATLLVARAPGRLRFAAAATAVGGWLIVAASVWWDIGLSRGVDPAGGPADGCFVLGSVCLLLGLLSAVWRVYPEERVDVTMLVLVVGTLTAALSWAIQEDFNERLDPATAAALALAVLNTVSTAVAARFLSMGGWRNPAAWLLVGGFALRAAGDLVYVTLDDYGLFKTGDVLDVTWMAGKLLLAAALLHRGLPALLADRAPGTPRLREGQLASMVGLVLLAPAVSTLPLPDQRARFVVAAAGALAGALAVGRLALLTRRMAVARQELAASESRYRQLFAGNSAAMLLIDPGDGRIVSANPAAAAFYGWPVEELTRMRITEINALPAAEVVEAMSKAQQSERSIFDFRHRRADGTVRDVQVFSGPVSLNGRDLLYSTVHDVTPLREERQARQAAEDLAYALLGQRVIGVGIASGEDDRLVQVNDRLAALLGSDPVSLTSRALLDLVHPDERPRLANLLRRVGGGDVSSAEEELRLVRDDGARIFVLATVAVLQAPDGGRHDWLLMVQDVSDRRAAEKQLRHQALHDPLTGLANRTLLLDRIVHALERGARRPEPLCVLFMDLDRFKATNDGFGHDVGDQLLREVARRLAGVMRPDDTLARLGGDEFAILCENTDPAGAQVVAKRLVGCLQVPFIVRGHRLHVGASVGIAAARPGSTAPLLLRDADLAMYHAKENGRGGVAVFDLSLHEAQLAEVQLDNSLHGALANGEITLHYQPLVRLSDMRPVAVEALVRWAHPVKGLLMPHEFVPAAEANGLIGPIGEYVLREACRQAGQWRREGLAVQVTVNVSAPQFRDPVLAGLVRSALEDAQLPPELLALEMTESLLMDDARTTVAVLDGLAATGVRLLVDDFGTGYSSLAYLKQFPVQGLKVDRSFVDGVPEEVLDRSIVIAIIQLARALGLEVIAEGIERPEQVEALAELGCRTGQGYLFARPAAADVVESYLRARQAAPPGLTPV